ncbi:MAG: glycosyltransferase family A protein [Arcobacteraceae bacterium]
MKISVVIPTYNRADFLSSCLQSVLTQTRSVDEIIVVDDGSIDHTQDVLKEFDIHYVYQTNQGVAHARNIGIQKAKNEWIAFLDSDDIWHRTKIEEHLAFHTHNPHCPASYTDELWIRNGKTITLKTHQQKEQPTFSNSLRACKIGASTFFCHKKIFEAVGYFDETLHVCEDYDLWLRILKEFPIYFINQALTTKQAGHEHQLSFSTKLIDTYRIEALKKHLESSYKKEVLEELIYKTTILLKGAKKHHNEAIIEKYEKELNTFLCLH